MQLIHVLSLEMPDNVGAPKRIPERNSTHATYSSSSVTAASGFGLHRNISNGFVGCVRTALVWMVWHNIAGAVKAAPTPHFDKFEEIR